MMKVEGAAFSAPLEVCCVARVPPPAQLPAMLFDACDSIVSGSSACSNHKHSCLRPAFQAITLSESTCR